MKRHRRTLTPHFIPLMTIFVILFSLSVYVAQTIDSRATVVLAPPLRTTINNPPALSAPQYLVFDIKTGAILVANNADVVVPIASVTKLFAASTMLSNHNLQATTSITWSDLAGDGAAGKLVYGQNYSARELLFPLLLESSNDAAHTLERMTEGTLVTNMNSWADTIGANNTQFVDASGIGEGDVSTALDIKLLMTDSFNNHPHIFDITSLPQYIGRYTGWLNNNPVSGEFGYRGGKHGYTVPANRTLAAVYDETINGHPYTLGYVILGSDNLATDFKALRQFITNSESNR